MWEKIHYCTLFGIKLYYCHYYVEFIGASVLNSYLILKQT